MYITSSRSYRQILLTILKVVGVISLLVAPIALLQVISAAKARPSEDAGARHEEANFASLESAPAAEQLGELFDVSNNQNRRQDGKFILRLKRQTYDEPLGGGGGANTNNQLAQLTAAGTAAGIEIGNQVAAAQMAAAETHPSPDQVLVEQQDDDDESSGVDELDKSQDPLSTLQSYNQRALNQQQQQHQDQQDINPEQMPDSMDALMRSENEDMGATDGQAQGGDGTEGQNLVEQPSAHTQVTHETLDAVRGDDDDDDDGNESGANLSPVPLSAAELPRSYLPIQSADDFVSGAAQSNYLSAINPNQLVSAAPLIDPNSAEDLSAAAGHHYKKKKKKKVKKIIVVKKKKKKGKKKYKKVKIIKYKKKKVVKKKKKPKKHHHHPVHDHGKYYMYAKVPKKKSWEFGFKKGNKKHWIERHEKGHKNKFKTKVKWYDKKSKGKGVHIWDYNHHDKKKKKHH